VDFELVVGENTVGTEKCL